MKKITNAGEKDDEKEEDKKEFLEVNDKEDEGTDL